MLTNQRVVYSEPLIPRGYHNIFTMEGQQMGGKPISRHSYFNYLIENHGNHVSQPPENFVAVVAAKIGRCQKRPAGIGTVYGRPGWHRERFLEGGEAGEVLITETSRVQLTF